MNDKIQTLGMANPNETERHEGPVECLGKTFANDKERRDYYTAILAEKLKDPEFRKIEGFPIGEDEDILNLSDPPYYTACPNPFIEDFISHYGRPYDPSDNYKREPYAADVSEGKNDPIYNAHSYHTKVPHKAIMRYILHYTNPGDIVFDGFCGTGMTGVAAQMCGDITTVESLGYRVEADNTILQGVEADTAGKFEWGKFSTLGPRFGILNDLAPIAAFMSKNYNSHENTQHLLRQAEEILQSLEDKHGWMFKTRHNEKHLGKINFTIWSDVFICSGCGNEIVFWNAAVDHINKKASDSFACSCGVINTKRGSERAWVNSFDSALNKTVRQAKQVPVLINYSLEGAGKRYTKAPDEHDFETINKIEALDFDGWIPINKIPDGDKTGEPIRLGLTHYHHLFRKRNLIVLAELWANILDEKSRLSFWATASHRILSKMASVAFSYYFNGGGGYVNAGTKGTLYISSTNPEVSAFSSLRSRLGKILFEVGDRYSTPITQTGSCLSQPNIPSESIDYIFIDPPFGSNIQYSDLNFLWEPWLKVITNIDNEAIESNTQKKDQNSYRKLMSLCFQECYRIIKPGRWMTIEFSNTKV